MDNENPLVRIDPQEQAPINDGVIDAEFEVTREADKTEAEPL